MAFRKPNSMDECIYFTQRSLFDENNQPTGEISAWVFREICPKCGKDKMGKPRDSKGKVKVRANEYVCPACAYTVDKQTYEDSIVAYAQYTCPHCKSSGEAQVPYLRKNINGVQTLRFACSKCSANLDVTKKMKEKKRPSKNTY